MGSIGTRVASAGSSWQNQKCFSVVRYSTSDFTIAKPDCASTTNTRSIIPSIHMDWSFHWAALCAKGFSILVDLMFSIRASPYQNSPIGIARDIAPAFSIPKVVQHPQEIQQSQLGTFNICCITHDHYGHIDENSITDLRDHMQLWVVLLGIKKWLMGQCWIDSSKIVELKWWQKLSVAKKKQIMVVLDTEGINESQDDIVWAQLTEG
jgi:hypothetical protein